MTSTHASTLLRALVAIAITAAVTILPTTATADSHDEEIPPPRVLVYSGTQAFRHASIPHGNGVLQTLATDTDAFTVDFTEDPAFLTLETLAGYDVVLWNSPSGPSFDSLGLQPAPTCEIPTSAVDGYVCHASPFSSTQQADFIHWTSCGGGFVGIHQAMDAWHDWEAFDELVGYVSLQHAQAGEAMIHVESDSPIASPFGEEGSAFAHFDEFYTAFEQPDALVSDFELLLSIGEFTDPDVERAQGAYYPDHAPMAWTSTFRGLNRSFTTNLGHEPATWDMPQYQASLLAGIAHVAEVRPDATCVTRGPDPADTPLSSIRQTAISLPGANSGGVPFTPGSYGIPLVIPQGTGLDYQNSDLAAHNLVSADTAPNGRKLFRSELTALQKIVPVLGVEALPPGDYAFYCEIHPAMDGALTVV